MGRDLAERFPEARAVFEAADDALGVELSRIAWTGPEDELTATRNAQPAILTHSVAVLRVLAERAGDVVLAAGHSLGEFTAYIAAGALSFETGVRAVRRRGELMYDAGLRRPGTMAAVLGLADEDVERVCRDASTAESVCIPANFNAPSQVVISGDVAAVERGMERARQAGAKRVVPLNVSGAFHSPLMVEAEDGLREYLDQAAFDEPAFPVVSNVTASPVATAVEAQRLLVQQLTSPVRWAESMRGMAEHGVSRFLELGPGNVLAGLMRRIDRGAEVTTLGTADQLTSYLET
jgi:[acyl-carrier-protein] S-malonyltransferase